MYTGISYWWIYELPASSDWIRILVRMDKSEHVWMEMSGFAFSSQIDSQWSKQIEWLGSRRWLMDIISVVPCIQMFWGMAASEDQTSILQKFPGNYVNWLVVGFKCTVNHKFHSDTCPFGAVMIICSYVKSIFSKLMCTGKREIVEQHLEDRTE